MTSFGLPGLKIRNFTASLKSRKIWKMNENTQPTGTAPMGILDNITGSYDEYVADAFSIGKTAYDAKGVIPKKAGQWKNGYYGFDNCGVCCAASI